MMSYDYDVYLQSIVEDIRIKELSPENIRKEQRRCLLGKIKDKMIDNFEVEDCNFDLNWQLSNADVEWLKLALQQSWDFVDINNKYDYEKKHMVCQFRLKKKIDMSFNVDKKVEELQPWIDDDDSLGASIEAMFND